MSDTESRITKTEMAIELLTQNMATLTKDVQSLVDSQAKMTELVTRQALQSQDQEHTKEALSRAFSEIKEVKQDLAAVQTNVAVCQAKYRGKQESEDRESLKYVIARYWAQIALLVAASGSSGALLESIVASAGLN